MMNKLFLLILLCSAFTAQGQNCESFDRSLFHFLSAEVPDTVNCIDSEGRKQGWWLNYKVKYNPVYQPDILAVGDYVENYSYGRYENDRKTGTWRLVENVHMVYERRIDSFYYNKDSIVHIAKFAAGQKSISRFNSDSSIVHFEHFLSNTEFPVIIDCDRTFIGNKQCIMTLEGRKIISFPYEEFELKKELISMDYFRIEKVFDKKFHE